MKPDMLKKMRKSLGLTQQELADRLQTTRTTIARYECGDRRIPGMIEVAIAQLNNTVQIPMAGLVAAGNPIEPIPQTELVEIPHAMLTNEKTFALRVKGESMKDDGILPNDLVIIRKQDMARNGQTVIALLNNEATIKKYYRKESQIELRPANATMQSIFVKPSDDFKLEGILIGVIRYCE
ncbi:MAG: transcriptional repressor LexA [Nitrospirales bacterium]|nr:transcriptional repressor LexA [Nitrospira sp.]MDR4499925.1 transcriptional repressor LexA [Nitrospirales bacterium]